MAAKGCIVAIWIASARCWVTSSVPSIITWMSSLRPHVRNVFWYAAAVSRHACSTSLLFAWLFSVDPLTTTTLMVSAVTPSDVAPPLSPPAGHGTTHDGAYFDGTFTRPVVRSQSGADRAPSVPTPALVGAATVTAAP